MPLTDLEIATELAQRAIHLSDALGDPVRTHIVRVHAAKLLIEEMRAAGPGTEQLTQTEPDVTNPNVIK